MRGCEDADRKVGTVDYKDLFKAKRPVQGLKAPKDWPKRSLSLGE